MRRESKRNAKQVKPEKRLFVSKNLEAFLAVHHPGTYSQSLKRGEVALMWAVLGDAFNCLQKGWHGKGVGDKRLGREAETWFFANDHYWPFSFVNICAVLGLDENYVREALKRKQFLRPTVGINRRIGVIKHRPPLAA